MGVGYSRRKFTKFRVNKFFDSIPLSMETRTKKMKTFVLEIENLLFLEYLANTLKLKKIIKQFLPDFNHRPL